MDMQIIISSQGSGSVMPLQLDIPGYRLEVSGIPAGRRLSIAGHSGRVTVSLIEDAQEAQPSQEAQPEAVEQAAVAEAAREPAPAEARLVPAEPEQLFQKLAALRKQIASEAKLPPYVIFHDVTLREMCRLLPADLQALKSIQGVGDAKLEKYGMRFIEAIQEYAGKAA